MHTFSILYSVEWQKRQITFSSLRSPGSRLDWKNGRPFSSQGKVFYPKYWKNQEILTLENGNKYWKSRGNLAVRKVKTMEIGCHALNNKKAEWLMAQLSAG